MISMKKLIKHIEQAYNVTQSDEQHGKQTKYEVESYHA